MYIEMNFRITDLFLVVLGVSCCLGFPLVVTSGISSLGVVHEPLIVAASLTVEYGFSSSGLWLSTYSSWAWWPHSMWDLSR